MKDITEEVLQYLYPSEEHLLARKELPGNHIVFRSIILLGDIGSGKTTLATYLLERGMRHYTNINACMDDDLSYLLNNALKDSLVNILYTDDITLQKIPSSTLHSFWRIRHLLEDRYQRRVGLVIVMFGLHRFHGVPLALRCDSDLIFFRTVPTNPFDRNLIKSFIGEEGISILQKWDIERESDPESEAWNKSIVYKKGTIGIFTSEYPETLDIWKRRGKGVVRTTWNKTDTVCIDGHPYVRFGNGIMISMSILKPYHRQGWFI